MAEGGLDEVVVHRTETDALRAELRELLTSTRVTVLLVVTAGLAVLSAAGATRSIVTTSGPVSQPLIERALIYIVGSALVTGTVGALLLGALAVPRAATGTRDGGWLLVLGAKTVANAAVALVYGVVAIGLSFVSIMVVAAIEGAEAPDLFAPAVLGAALAGLAAYPLWAIIGIGVGAIAGSDAGAVGASLLWLPVERGLVTLLRAGEGTTAHGYLPLSATAVMVSPSEQGPFVTGIATRPGAVMVLVAYAVVFLVLGSLAISRRQRRADTTDEPPAPAPDAVVSPPED